MKNALKITAIYMAFGGIWIVLTDDLAFSMFKGNLSFLENIQHFKGFLYVLLSGVLVFILTNRVIAIENKGQKLENQIAYELGEKNALINNTDALIWSVDQDIKLKSFNEPFANTLRQITSRNPQPGDSALLEGVNEQIISFWKEYYQRGLSGEKHTVLQPPFSEGLSGFTSININPVWQDGKVIGVSCFSKDVTVEILAKKELEASEEKYRQLFHGSPIPFWIFDPATLYFLEVNTAAVQKYGYSREEYLSMRLWSLWDNDDLLMKNTGILPDNWSSWTAGDHFESATLHQRKDGEKLNVKVFFQFHQFTEKPAIFLSAIDISKEKVSEQQIISEVIKATESEREQMAMEIHDNLIQILGMANMYAQNLSYDVPGLNDHPKYHQAIKYLSEGIHLGRNISHRLMPQSILDFGLVTAISEMVEEFEAIYPVSVHCFCEHTINPPTEQSINLYRIVQEALANVQKHAHAKDVWISLALENNIINLEIRDNGIGIKGGDMFYFHEGIGLRIMQNRTVQMNGFFSIRTKENEGTELKFRIPLQ
ncbi:MAG: PAS domain S-box protein [Bacteroidia bacterium]